MESEWPTIEESKRKKAYHQANLAELRHGQRAGDYEDANHAAIALEWLAVEARRRLESLPANLASLFSLNPTVAAEVLADALSEASGVFDNLAMYEAMVRGDDS